MTTKEVFFEGYRWCLSEMDRDWEDYAQDCEDCWNVSKAKKEMETGTLEDISEQA